MKTVPVEIERPSSSPAPVPHPAPIVTQPVQWKVLTGDALSEGDQRVYYALTPNEYEVLARNMAEVLRWVKEAMWRLRYYRGEGSMNGTGPDHPHPDR